jgi:hypothetical protein
MGSGWNQSIYGRRGYPIEFQLVGVKKFTIKDVYNIFGYMSLVLPWHKNRSV